MLRVVSLVLALSMTAGPVCAKGGKKSDGDPPGHGNPHHAGPVSSPGHGNKINITVNERTVINNYYAGYGARGFCPPGLAKKNNGCLQPGIAKKYVIGQPLPPAIVYQPLPPDLALRLVAPVGYRYVYLDGSVLLMALSTRMVVDAITISIRF